MAFHRRILLPKPDDPACYKPHCPSSPSPPPLILSPPPSPDSCPPPPPFPYSPAFPPFSDAAVGRGDGGRSPGGHAYDHRVILIAVSALAFLSLVSVAVAVAVRRRRRQALLATPAAAAAAANSDDGNDPDDGGGGVLHHVWYIRTVGLDEAAIESIAVAEYRAGGGLLGAADCSVCLGEFRDGELVRLLPKCGHAFHVLCIDTWLRSHVNCPLCRSDVLDPTATAAADDPSPIVDANANAGVEQVASNGILEQEEEEEQEVLHIDIDQYDQFSSPELLPQFPGLRPQNARRSASMDSAIVSAVADVAALAQQPGVTPQWEQSSKEKQGNGSCKVSGSRHLSHLDAERSLFGSGRRSFFSRHCRARSSVLPL